MSVKKYEAISDHAQKRSKKLKYFHGYKKIDVIINSRIIREAPMEVVNPFVMVSRLDLVLVDSAAAGIGFHRLH